MSLRATNAAGSPSTAWVPFAARAWTLTASPSATSARSWTPSPLTSATTSFAEARSNVTAWPTKPPLRTCALPDVTVTVPGAVKVPLKTNLTVLGAFSCLA